MVDAINYDELDPDVADQVRAALSASQEQAEKKAALAEAKLTLVTDKELRTKYPRALMAFDKGKLDISDPATINDLLAAKEQELEEYGVPVPGASEAAAPVEANPETPPQADWGGSVPPAGTPTPALDVARTVEEAITGSTPMNMAQMLSVLEAAQSGPERDKNRAALIDMVEKHWDSGRY